MPNKYRVKEGIHIHTDHKKYRKGDIVVTDIDLPAKFPGKFEFVGEAPSSQPAPKLVTSKIPAAAPTPVAEEDPSEEEGEDAEQPSEEEGEDAEQPSEEEAVEKPAPAPARRRKGKKKTAVGDDDWE